MNCRRFICGLLAILLLLADSGQMIYAHTCTKSGRTSFSVSSGAGCCNMDFKTNNKLSFKKISCCQITAKYVKQSVAATTQLLPSYNLTIPAFVLSDIFRIATPVFNFRNALYFSPPGSGKNNKCFTGVFRC